MTALSLDFNYADSPAKDLCAKDYTVIIEPPYPSGWRMIPHSHVQYEMTLVRSGACHISLGHDLRLMQSGDVIFIPSRVAHGHEPYLNHEVELLVVQFPHLNAELVQELINATPLGLYHLSELEKSRFMSLCYQMQREIAGGLAHATHVCRAYIEQMAVLLLRSQTSGENKSLTFEQQTAIETALQWMHDHAHKPLTISDVATYIGFSTAHFRALFRQAVGVSPKQYLTALRLQASKCLLMHAERTVTEVAQLAGFNSPQEFSKVFRHFTGLTPSEWKRTHLYLP
jgi:AraC family transcriptional regulator, arabinose operon regulatory protein